LQTSSQERAATFLRLIGVFVFSQLDWERKRFAAESGGHANEKSFLSELLMNPFFCRKLYEQPQRERKSAGKQNGHNANISHGHC